MNNARLQSFLDAYVVALAQAITARPKDYTLRPDDTAETYALRVTLVQADLMARGAGVLDFERSEAVRGACAALGVYCTEEKLNHYLMGGT